MARQVKKHKNTKKKVIVITVLILVISLATVFAGYVLNKSDDFYSRTKEFYFNSDRLAADMPVYKIENWSGVDDYLITINMNSKDNNLVAATYNINYQISATCSGNLVSQLSKPSGVIPNTTNTDTFTLLISPNGLLQAGDTAYVEITATANSPYQKTLKARFNLVVGQEKISYEIIDRAGGEYLELSISNTLSYYTVKQAFGGYIVGDRINRDVYSTLSSADMAKCYSAIVNLSFDPNVVLMDMTDLNYLNATNTGDILKGAYRYINNITFKVEASTSTKVRFYKVNTSQNYTYPNPGNGSPIITVGIT